MGTQQTNTSTAMRSDDCSKVINTCVKPARTLSQWRRHYNFIKAKNNFLVALWIRDSDNFADDATHNNRNANEAANHHQTTIMEYGGHSPSLGAIYPVYRELARK